MVYLELHRVHSGIFLLGDIPGFVRSTGGGYPLFVGEAYLPPEDLLISGSLGYSLGRSEHPVPPFDAVASR